MWERLKLTAMVTKVIAGVYFKIWLPVLIWLVIAWYFDIPLVIALLIYISL